LKNLTEDIALIQYLLSLKQKEEERLKGKKISQIKIRPISIQSKCPDCGKLFEEVHKLGFICREHKKTPSKFYLDLHYKGKRERIFADMYDNILDSYSATQTLQGKIFVDMANGTFDPSHYIKKEKEKYYLLGRWKEFVKRNDNPKYLLQINYAKGYTFKHFSASQDIRDIRQTDIQLFAEAIPTLSKNGKVKGKTISNIVGVLLSLLNHDTSVGLREGLLISPPIEIIKQPKNIPELAESLEIISHVDNEMRIIYLFLITHLCRPADARALYAKHFNFDQNVVKIEQGFSGNQLGTTKSKKPYKIPIHPALRNKLQALCIAKMPDDFVFTYKGNFWREARIREIWDEAAVKAESTVTFYNGVKHAGASHAASESGDIYNTSKLIGHANVSTTQIYTEKIKIEKLREVQKCTSPGLMDTPKS